MTEKNADVAALEGIRVLDISTFIAAPFCGVILADFGAEVLKFEKPGEGDPLRAFGTPTGPDGDSLVWLSEARNKKSVTLDLRQSEGVEIFKRLVKDADVVLENFRPGTLERWGLGYDVLKEINPGIIMMRISGYGQSGPYSNRPGFARAAHAFAGLAYLCGEEGRKPVMPGSTSLADYVSGMWGAIGVLLALEARRKTGEGQVIDIGLYESVFRLLDDMLPTYVRTGFVRERLGADTVNAVPHSHYETADGRFVALACSTDKIFARMCEIMGQPELAAPGRFATFDARFEARDEVNQIVQGWMIERSADEIVTLCQDGGVPCSILLSVADIYEDPHYNARGNFEVFDDPRHQEVTVPTAMPRLTGTPGVLKHLGPDLGSSTQETLETLLGMSADQIAELRKRKVI